MEERLIISKMLIDFCDRIKFYCESMHEHNIEEKKMYIKHDVEHIRQLAEHFPSDWVDAEQRMPNFEAYPHTEPIRGISYGRLPFVVTFYQKGKMPGATLAYLKKSEKSGVQFAAYDLHVKNLKVIHWIALPGLPMVDDKYICPYTKIN
jgi:hypothetical protein